jgi:hypothetical protein
VNIVQAKKVIKINDFKKKGWVFYHPTFLLHKSAFQAMLLVKIPLSASIRVRSIVLVRVCFERRKVFQSIAMVYWRRRLYCTNEKQVANHVFNHSST